MQVLTHFDRWLLIEGGFYFAGGPAIVRELGEYRELVDIIFFCASAESYRRLRNLVSFESLNAICHHPIALQREVHMGAIHDLAWQRAEAAYGASVRWVYQKTLLLLQNPNYYREFLRQMQIEVGLDFRIIQALGLPIEGSND